MLANIHRDETQSVGIITSDQKTAEQIAAAITNGQLITTQGQQVIAGINIMDLATAKGLEFDHTIIIDWENDFYKDSINGDNRRYVAASRGTKTLTIIHERFT